MKKILILIIAIFFDNLTAQEEQIARKEIEIFMISKNVSGKNIFYKMKTLKDFVYENDASRWNYSHTSNSKWIESTLPLGAPSNLINSDDITNNSAAPWTWRGFDFVSGSEEHNPEQPDFAYGIYRFSCFEQTELNGIIELPGWFFIDYRDNYFPADEPPGPDINPYSNAGVDNDIFIKYDLNSGKFFYTHDESYANYTTGTWSNQIEQGELISIWQISNLINYSPKTFYFPSPHYWSNCLNLISSQTGNHPRLVWGPYPNENFILNYYEIYKKKDNSPFQLLATTTLEGYIDEDEVIPVTPETVVPVWYKVKAIGEMEDDSFTSDYTNTVNVNVEGGLSKQFFNIDNSEFNLFQNYPNPFNPVTKISYRMKNAGNVTLKVYDVLGNLVTTLINSEINAGLHEINFNAENLASGIYYYQLKSGGFLETRKMILLK